MDICFALQISIDKFEQNTLAGGQGRKLGVSRCLHGKVGFSVLPPRKPRAPGGVGMFHTIALVHLDGRELILLLVTVGGAEGHLQSSPALSSS